VVQEWFDVYHDELNADRINSYVVDLYGREEEEELKVWPTYGDPPDDEEYDEDEDYEDGDYDDEDDEEWEYEEDDAGEGEAPVDELPTTPQVEIK
jgi:hypothetical protein